MDNIVFSLIYFNKNSGGVWGGGSLLDVLPGHSIQLPGHSIQLVVGCLIVRDR